VIAGERGVGKSHLLAFIAALLRKPELASYVGYAPARNSIERLLTTLSIFPNVVTVNFDTVDRKTSQDLIKTSLEEASKKEGSKTIFFFDSFSHQAERDEAWLDWFKKELETILEQKASVFVELNSDDLFKLNLKQESVKVEAMGLKDLAQVIDKVVCQKSAKQRQAIKDLYEDLQHYFPYFQTSTGEFIELFPIHPQVLKIVPVMRKYANRFSLFGFFYSVAPRAVLRRGLNVVSLIDLFDSFEFELRRNHHLSYLFSSYDFLVENFVRALPSVQQVYGKMLLGTLTLLSITGKPHTMFEIAESAMLYDDGSPVLLQNSLRSLIDFMAMAAGDRIELIDSDKGDVGFRLRLSADFVDPLEKAASQISDNDPRLCEVLIDAGKLCFKDWPLVYTSDHFKRSVETEMVWQGSRRRGKVELFDRHVELIRGDYDWELLILSPFEIAGGVEPDLTSFQTAERTIVWYPSELFAEELDILKRLVVVLGQGSKILSKERYNTEQAYLTAQSVRIFIRSYIELGRIGLANFKHPFHSRSRRISVPLNNILSQIFASAYPLHPHFKAVLNEKDFKQIVKNFFYQKDWDKEEVKDCLDKFAVALHIVSLSEDGQYRYRAASEVEADSPLGKIIEMTSEATELERKQLEEILKAAPFGMKQSAIFLLVMGATAAGYIELLNAAGEVILTHKGAKRGSDIGSYSSLRLVKVDAKEQVSEAKVFTFTGSLDLIFQDVVAEALKYEPDPDHSMPLPSSEDVLVEFYQSGFFSRSGLSSLSSLKKLENEPKREEAFELASVRKLEENAVLDQAIFAQTHELEPAEEVAVGKIAKNSFAFIEESRLIIAKKLPFDRAPVKELSELYNEFLSASATYQTTGSHYSFEEFSAKILLKSKELLQTTRSKEIWCQVEVENGVVKVYCQAGRASLFQKKPPKAVVL
ncbi:MAG: hypothetical protein JNN15_16230, partial [Blastocatellia bacterium]|nr:hypothetical protein [Blastocatellia bacterium]